VRALAEKNEPRLSFLQNFALIKLLRLQLRPELKIIYMWSLIKERN